MTWSDWRLNPGGIFHGASGTNWSFVFETAISWFVPAIPAAVILSAAALFLVLPRASGTAGSDERGQMLNIESVNHVGIRVSDKQRSIDFYATLGFELVSDHGFDQGHPVVMKHPSGVVLNLLGPATSGAGSNILMDVDEKYPGITHVALTVSSLDDARAFVGENGIEITGSFSFGSMSAIFIRDPDRNVIELDAYADGENTGGRGYSDHPG